MATHSGALDADTIQAMSTNDRVLLDGILKSRQATIAPEMKDDEFFELFLAEQLLWTKDLSWEELIDGIIGGGGDGGIDTLYVFCNDVLLSSDSTVPDARGAVHFELFAIQAKRTAGFGETAIDKIRNSFSELLDFDRNLEGLSSYSEELLAIVDRFRQAYVANASKFPSISLHIYYGSRGFDIHPNVLRKSKQLEETLTGLFSAASCTFTFVTPSDLVSMARRQRPTTLDLKVNEVMTTSTGGWVALVGLDSYFDFISTTEGELRGAIFDSNVRDYETNSKVNLGIRGTLDNSEGDDFWWLNNGITVVTTRAGQSGKKLTLEYPQIVNGLQTTREIYNHIEQRRTEQGTSHDNDGRSVLVRIIVPLSDSSRDRIIRATNSQTTMPTVALRATDTIQREIEEYFLQHGLYYERRKNHYQNEGKPITRIATVPYVAEAVLAALLNEPHLGQPRLGGGFLRSEAAYHKVFNTSIPLSSYLQSFKLARSIEMHIRSSREGSDRGNKRTRRGAIRYLFPTTMAVAVMYGPLEDLNVDELSNDITESCLAICMAVDSTPRRKWKGTGGPDVRFGNALLEKIRSLQGGGAESINDDPSATSATDLGSRH